MNFSILAPGSIARKMAEAVTGLSDEYKKEYRKSTKLCGRVGL